MLPYRRPPTSLFCAEIACSPIADTISASDVRGVRMCEHEPELSEPRGRLHVCTCAQACACVIGSCVDVAAGDLRRGRWSGPGREGWDSRNEYGILRLYTSVFVAVVQCTQSAIPSRFLDVMLILTCGIAPSCSAGSQYHSPI